MIAPTDRRDDRMYVYTVRSWRRSVARPIAATIASCKHANRPNLDVTYSSKQHCHDSD